MVDIMKCTGVYMLSFYGSDKFYIGSTSLSFEKRLRVHLSELRNGRHHNQPMQRAYVKYGESAIVMEPIIICSPKDCVSMEVLAIRFMRPSYNASSVSNTRKGVITSDETKAKLSNAHKGKTLTEEHKKNISIGLIGKYVMPDKHREALSERMTGRTVSLSTREKIRVANVGKQHTQETKEKMSKAHSKAIRKDVYHFVNSNGDEFVGTLYDIKKAHGLNSHIHGVLNGKRSHCKGWRLNNRF